MYYYGGAPITTNSSRDAVTQVIQWFLNNGGTNTSLNPPDYVQIGGLNTQLAGSLKAPDMDEWTIGAGFQLSPNAYLRADYISREWGNYYGSFTNQETGFVDNPDGTRSDLTLITNTDLLTREYHGVQLQGQYRAFNRLNIGGNYTWSELQGNAEGETSGSGPVAEGGWILTYPEFQGFQQNRPYGYLSGDQRHKLRVWAGMDFPLGPAGTLNASVMQRFDSGTPYNATFLLPTSFTSATERAAYLQEPANVTHFVNTERGAFRWDDVTRTDFALNYRVPIAGIELFAEGEVFNLFNEQAQIGGVTTVVGPSNSTRACGNGTVRCAAFNPFTTTPVEGVNYQRLTSSIASTLGIPQTSVFGAATSKTHYQLARTYQFSLGLRF